MGRGIAISSNTNSIEICETKSIMTLKQLQKAIGDADANALMLLFDSMVRGENSVQGLHRVCASDHPAKVQTVHLGGSSDHPVKKPHQNTGVCNNNG